MRERSLFQSIAALWGHSQESRRTTSQPCIALHSTPCFILKSLPYLPSAVRISLVLISCIVCEDALMRSAKLFIYWTDSFLLPLRCMLASAQTIPLMWGGSWWSCYDSLPLEAQCCTINSNKLWPRQQQPRYSKTYDPLSSACTLFAFEAVSFSFFLTTGSNYC